MRSPAPPTGAPRGAGKLGRVSRNSRLRLTFTLTLASSRRSTLDARRSTLTPTPSPHASRPHALSPHPHAMPTHPHTLTPSHPHASPSHPRPRGSPSLHTPRRQRDSPHTLTGSSERRRGPPWTSPSSRRCRRYASGPSPSPAPSHSPGLTSSPSPSPSNSPLGPAEGQPVWALAGRAPGAQGEGEFAASPPRARCSNDRA